MKTRGLKKLFKSEGFRTLRKIVVGIVGMAVILVGIVLLFFPGPAFVVIPVIYANCITASDIRCGLQSSRGEFVGNRRGTRFAKWFPNKVASLPFPARGWNHWEREWAT